MLRQLAERMIEKDEKMYAVFVHLEKANNKVFRESCGEFCRDMVCQVSCREP